MIEENILRLIGRLVKYNGRIYEILNKRDGWVMLWMIVPVPKHQHQSIREITEPDFNSKCELLHPEEETELDKLSMYEQYFDNEGGN